MVSGTPDPDYYARRPTGRQHRAVDQKFVNRK